MTSYNLWWQTNFFTRNKNRTVVLYFAQFLYADCFLFPQSSSEHLFRRISQPLTFTLRCIKVCMPRGVISQDRQLVFGLLPTRACNDGPFTLQNWTDAHATMPARHGHILSLSQLVRSYLETNLALKSNLWPVGTRRKTCLARQQQQHQPTTYL